MRSLLVLALLLVGCFDGYGSQWSDTPLLDDDDTPDLTLGHECGELAEGIDPDVAAGNVGDPEICNDLDDDCDGLIDTDDPDLTDGIDVHPDADGDGYGDPDITITVCSIEDGYTENDQDCDDTDAAVNPDAIEAWNDGVDADCDGTEDPDPCESTPTGVDVDEDPTCEVVPGLGWFNPAIAWTLEDAPVPSELWEGSTGSPMVGHLIDDNGDGVVDGPGDVPEIALIVGDFDPYITLIAGDASAVTTLPWPTHPDDWIYPNYQADLALGDIDGDGAPEIVSTWVEKTLDEDLCRVGAQEVGGTFTWFRDDLSFGCGHHAAALADLTGDGSVEVIYGDHVFDGATGVTLWVGGAGAGIDPDYINSGFHSFAADLDGDGSQEVITGQTVYRATGSVFCTLSTLDGYPAVANLDADAGLEIVITGRGVVRVYDDTCAELVNREVIDGGSGGPATIADFDGDGALEIGVAGEITYTVYESDGTPLWSSPITDISSGSTSSVAFDFDGDGAWEVVYGDENDLWVFDGSTGTPLMQNPWRGSGTRNEQPAVADIDGDGSAEIVVSNDQGSPSLFVLEDSLGRWPGARPVWNQHAFHPSGVTDSLEVAAASPYAPDGFRLIAPIGTAPDDTAVPELAPDLRVEVWGTCETLPGLAQYWWQVVNEGAVAAPPETRVQVILEDDFGGTQLQFDEPLSEELLPGEEGLIFSGSVIEPFLSSYDRLVFTADADLLVQECDEDNNEVEMYLPD
jgi:hypothetical protein